MSRVALIAFLAACRSARPGPLASAGDVDADTDADMDADVDADTDSADTADPLPDLGNRRAPGYLRDARPPPGEGTSMSSDAAPGRDA